MGRAKSLNHASYIKRAYQLDFPDGEKYRQLLEDMKFGSLPPEYFTELAAGGYGFSNLSAETQDGKGTPDYLKWLKALPRVTIDGLDLVVVNEFNIFQSMNNDARLCIVSKDDDFAFLRAKYGGNDIETFAVIAAKREYAQPLLLHQVLKRVWNAKLGN